MDHQFLNCVFEYECPKNWFELEATSKAAIKYCTECNKDVYLCINQEELDYAISQKFCIAYFQDPNLQVRFKISREECEVNKNSATFLQHATVGIPSGAYSISKLFESLNSDDKDE